MLVSVAELQQAMHASFHDFARAAAKHHGFCRRERSLTGPVFVQALVFCLLENPNSTLDDFAQFASDHLDVHVTGNAFDERFGRPSACLLLDVFLEAFDLSFSSLRADLLPVLRHFDGVYLRDATTVRLPACLADLLPGRVGRASSQGEGAAAVKLVLEVEVCTGQFTEFSVLAGTANEKTAEVSCKPLPKGALLLEDMGFLSGQRLQDYLAQGVYVLTRVPCWTAFYVKRGGRFVPLDLLKWLRKAKGACLQRQVYVLHQEKVAMRLLAVPVPQGVAQQRRQHVAEEAKKRGRPVSKKKLELCEWNILLTNAPRGLLSVYEAWDVRRVRWQVELVFKVFKSEAGIDRSRSRDGWRVLTELFAKLLGQVVQQWLLQAAGYVMLRHSLRRASRRVRRRAGAVLEAMRSEEGLRREVGRLAKVLDKYCRLERRKKTPSTFDRLASHDYEFRCLDQAG